MFQMTLCCMQQIEFACLNNCGSTHWPPHLGDFNLVPKNWRCRFNWRLAKSWGLSIETHGDRLSNPYFHTSHRHQSSSNRFATPASLLCSMDANIFHKPQGFSSSSDSRCWFHMLFRELSQGISHCNNNFHKDGLHLSKEVNQSITALYSSMLDLQQMWGFRK